MYQTHISLQFQRAFRSIRFCRYMQLRAPGVKIHIHCVLNENRYHGKIGLRYAKTCLRAYADSEGTDQTARKRSLIWAFAVR